MVDETEFDIMDADHESRLNDASVISCAQVKFMPKTFDSKGVVINEHSKAGDHEFILERTMSFYHALLFIDGKKITSVTSDEQAIDICNKFLENNSTPLDG